VRLNDLAIYVPAVQEDWQGETAPRYLLCAQRQMQSPAIDLPRHFLRQRLGAYLAGA
jgi:hypothetical protein